VDFVDYKDPNKLKKFVTERGKILPRRISGNCSRHQHTLTIAIKRARDIALMAYTTDG
jgi:small subunit ribosomal protein S18